MIRSEHSIVEYDFQRLRVYPDRLRRATDADYVDAAKLMLRIYRSGVGQRRQDLHGQIEETLSRLPGCPPRRIASFCKLLDDQSEYASGRKTAFELRRKVFDFASNRHPIVEQREGIFESAIDEVRQQIATELNRPWNEIEALLFSDVIELQCLQQFNCDLTPQQLLALYNVSQTQAALYRATRVHVDAYADFKTIIKHAKLAGLMHQIDAISCRAKVGYRFVFDGPQAGLRETTRYGIRFAALVPKLLSCRDWNLVAEVVGPRGQRFRLNLSPEDGLTSVLKSPDEFDSMLEAEVDAAWHHSPVEGWDWKHESELLVHGQIVMTPDFSLHHQSGDVLIYVEVVGYWTPEYLQEKCRRLSQFALNGRGEIAEGKMVKWLLIVPKELRSDRIQQLVDLQIPIVHFDKKSDPKTWMECALEG